MAHCIMNVFEGHRVESLNHNGIVIKTEESKENASPVSRNNDCKCLEHRWLSKNLINIIQLIQKIPDYNRCAFSVSRAIWQFVETAR